MKEKDSLNNDRLAHFVNRFDEYEKLVQKFPKILNPLPVLFIRVMGVLLFLWFPFAIIDVRNMSDSVVVSFTSAIVVIFLNVLVFFWNQNFFVPKLFFKKKYVQYVLINFLCLLFVICLYQLSWITMSKWILGHIVSIYEVKASLPIVFVKFLVLSFFICFMNIVLFVASVQAHLYYQRYTKKEIESNVKMEFLKRQLSPHFLFNSMNNVISMMDIDVQKSKQQMFDLVAILRTLLYDNQAQSVVLAREIEFIKRFINLEKMRFDDSMEIMFNTNCEHSKKNIVPMLFLPLVENAFKHSLNLNGKSFIHIEITEDANSIIYQSENTNFPKKAKDGVSSGVGLETFLKRLELSYHEKYVYQTHIENDVYKVFFKLDLDDVAD
jgi:hypothetical protein